MTISVSVMPAPHGVIARRKLHLFRHGSLRIGDVAAEIAVARIDEDVGCELRVLGPDRRRTLRQLHMRHLPERDRGAVGERHQHLTRNRVGIGTHVARISETDSVALAALDRRRHGLGAESA
jgi:hypothetical protein